jgi:tRNA 2-selenouridine synthase
VFEDEGSNVGTVHIPQCVQDKTSQAELILLEASVEQRLKVSMDAYVINMKQDFIQQDAVNGFDSFANYWLRSLEKIQRRLGLERYQAIIKLVNSALERYKNQDKADEFYPVVEELLVGYYDPMYDYQIQKKMDRVVFKGDANEVLDYLNNRSIG